MRADTSTSLPVGHRMGGGAMVSTAICYVRVLHCNVLTNLSPMEGK